MTGPTSKCPKCGTTDTLDRFVDRTHVCIEDLLSEEDVQHVIDELSLSEAVPGRDHVSLETVANVVAEFASTQVKILIVMQEILDERRASKIEKGYSFDRDEKPKVSRDLSALTFTFGFVSGGLIFGALLSIII